MAADKNLQTAFDLLCTTSGGQDGEMSLDFINKWFKQSGLVCKETGITEKLVQTSLEESAKNKKMAGFAELKDCIANIAKEKEMQAKDIMTRLASVAPPKIGKDTGLVADAEKKIGKGTM